MCCLRPAQAAGHADHMQQDALSWALLVGSRGRQVHAAHAQPTHNQTAPLRTHVVPDRHSMRKSKARKHTKHTKQDALDCANREENPTLLGIYAKLPCRTFCKLGSRTGQQGQMCAHNDTWTALI